MTGGLYFRAQDLQSLAGIYAELDRLEPASGEPMFVRPSVSLFYLPLGAALVLTSLFMLLVLQFGSRTPSSRKRGIPTHSLKPSTDSGALS